MVLAGPLKLIQDNSEFHIYAGEAVSPEPHEFNGSGADAFI
jgi:hypothetical protein